MVKKAKLNDYLQPNTALIVEQSESETGSQALARKVLDPNFRHAQTGSVFADKLLSTTIQAPGLMDYISHIQSVTKSAKNGDLAMASRILAAQAITLDSMFTELSRRTALNMGSYINAADRHGRLALKAQSNCQPTLETLAKLHQPREQTIKHVHVNDGGQAAVAGEFHHHAGGSENAETVKLSHTSGTPCNSATMLGKDTAENRMRITSREGEAAMQDARRD